MPVSAAPSLFRFLSEQGWLSLGGVHAPIELTPSYRYGFLFRPQPGQPCLLRFKEDDADCELYLKHLLRAIAARFLAERVHALAATRNLKVAKVSVRDQKGRWGSRSSSGTLSLNWRLLLVDARLQDYVIWHELAHITEMNHGPGFWQLLQSYDPLMREHERLLKSIGARIMALGREKMR